SRGRPVPGAEAGRGLQLAGVGGRPHPPPGLRPRRRPRRRRRPPARRGATLSAPRYRPPMRTLTDDELATHVADIAEDGYTVIEDAIERDLVDDLVDALERLERDLAVEPAENSFEGRHTLRVYNLLVHGPVWGRVPPHPNVLPLVEAVLDPGCLLSSLSSIAIGPDETPQPIHADDQLIPLTKPHVPIVCNTMWALTDFTDDNGPTRIIPGSHLRDHSPDYFTRYDSIPAEMPKGSVMVYNGSLWHGGGANRTDRRRIGVAMNY